jgi:signal transduction histidine kinase
MARPVKIMGWDEPVKVEVEDAPPDRMLLLMQEIRQRGRVDQDESAPKSDEEKRELEAEASTDPDAPLTPLQESFAQARFAGMTVMEAYEAAGYTGASPTRAHRVNQHPAVKARLAALRTQLHPHFVFNALNAIVALEHTDPMTADRMLTRFAALLRFVLQAGVSEEHALRDELAGLRQYLEMMQLRFGDRLQVEWDIDPALLDRQVPWMVLQPLVENALEHGLGDRSEPGHLRIAASGDGDTMQLTVEDEGPGLPDTGNLATMLAKCKFL